MNEVVIYESKLNVIEETIPVQFIDGDSIDDFTAGITVSYSNPVYSDHNLLNDRIKKFFIRLMQVDKKPTITGLSLYLGYCDKSSFYNMRDNANYPLSSYLLKRAAHIIENWYEEGLHDNKRVTGSIFALKNMGWYDNQKIEIGLDNAIKAPRMTQEEINSIADQIKSKI